MKNCIDYIKYFLIIWNFELIRKKSTFNIVSEYRKKSEKINFIFNDQDFPAMIFELCKH